jgi:hypothetical protein
MLAIERGAVDPQRRTQFVLPRQTQLNHLAGRHAAPHKIIGPMDEQRHARGEVRDLLVPLDHRDHRIDLPGAGGLDWQGQLGRHRPPSRDGRCMDYYASFSPESRNIGLVPRPCQEP